MTTFTVSGIQPVPAGTYTAELLEIEERDTEYGRRLKWQFSIPAAEGRTVNRFTSTSFSEKSRAMEIVSALFGRKLSRGETFTKEELIGRRCQLVLGVSETGWNDVLAAVPLAPRAPARAPMPEPELADLEEGRY